MTGTVFGPSHDGTRRPPDARDRPDPATPGEAGSGAEAWREAVTGEEPTGDERVDAVVDRLARVDELPLADQVAVYDDVHGALQKILTDVEQV